MKQFTVFVLIALLGTCLSVKTNNQANMEVSASMKKLQTSRWGQVAASFLELQTAVGSPVNDLLQAFQDFLHDVNFKVEIEQFDFNVKEAEHDEWEAAIRDRIASAQADIAAATHSLDNVLYPRKAQLEEQLRRDRQLIVDTNADMAAATAEREAESAANAAWVEEAQTAIVALDDCLTILSVLGGPETSLIQMTKAKKAFEKVERALAHTQYGSIVKALIKLADFTNSEMLNKLVAKFNEVKGSLQDGIAETLAREAAQQAAYEEFMALCRQTIADAEQRIVDNTAALAATNQEIADTEAFRAQREADLAVAEEDLEDELARWANEVALFEKLMGELQGELDALDQVIEVLSTIYVSQETFERLNQ